MSNIIIMKKNVLEILEFFGFIIIGIAMFVTLYLINDLICLLWHNH